jgi:hypothetical protein
MLSRSPPVKLASSRKRTGVRIGGDLFAGSQLPDLVELQLSSYGCDWARVPGIADGLLKTTTTVAFTSTAATAA